MEYVYVCQDCGKRYLFIIHLTLSASTKRSGDFICPCQDTLDTEAVLEEAERVLRNGGETQSI